MCPTDPGQLPQFGSPGIIRLFLLERTWNPLVFLTEQLIVFPKNKRVDSPVYGNNPKV